MSTTWLLPRLIRVCMYVLLKTTVSLVCITLPFFILRHAPFPPADYLILLGRLAIAIVIITFMKHCGNREILFFIDLCSTLLMPINTEASHGKLCSISCSGSKQPVAFTRLALRMLLLQSFWQLSSCLTNSTVTPALLVALSSTAYGRFAVWIKWYKTIYIVSGYVFIRCDILVTQSVQCLEDGMKVDKAC